MKRTTEVIRMFGINLALLGTLASASAAHAEVYVNHPGTICKSYNPGDAQYIQNVSGGISSSKLTYTQVICPVVRPVNTANGAGVYVAIKHLVNATTICTVYNYSFDGSWFRSFTQDWTGGASWGQVWELYFPMFGADKPSAYSDISVVCTIPGNGKGIVMGVDLKEL